MKSKAAIIDKIKGSVLIEEYDVPEPAPGGFILRTEICTICGSDAHIYEGHMKALSFPNLLGHEFCGTIEKLGEGVTCDANGESVSEGDRVVIVPTVSCGTCYNCTILKTPTHCLNGIGYGSEAPHLLTGGYSQYVHIKYPNSKFFKTTAAPEVAALAEPLSIALCAYKRAGGVPFGGTIVVQGTGAIGIGAIAFAKLGGAKRIIAIGGPKNRLELVKEFGADYTIDIEEMPDPAERLKYVKSLTPGNHGADMVVEAAGFLPTIPQAIDMLRTSGVLLELGHFTDIGPIQLNPCTQINRKNCVIHGVCGSATEDIGLSLATIEKGDLPYHKIVSHIIPLSKIQDAFHALSNASYLLEGRHACKIAVDPWME